MEFREDIKEFIINKDTYALCKILLRYEGKPLVLTHSQEEIVQIIAFATKKRVCVNACTRYGKSLCVAAGLCLYILFNDNRKNAIIAPQADQTGIIRNYMAQLIAESPIFDGFVQIQATGRDKLLKEASRSRQTFNNGSEYRVFSAEGEANRLMGFGVNGLLICLKGDTKITMKDGSKCIKSLKEGDVVLSYNEDKRLMEYKTVQKVYKSEPNSIYEVVLENGKKLEITGNHPVYTPKGIKKVEELEVGEELLQ